MSEKSSVWLSSWQGQQAAQLASMFCLSESVLRQNDKNLIPDRFLAEIVLIRTKFHTGEIFVRNCAPNVMHKFCGMTTVACSSYSFDNALQYCKRN